MKALALLFLLLLAAGLTAQEPAVEERRAMFRALDIYLDSKGSPLAAYQVELAITNGAAKIVGIEGGEHAAFHEPPFYDPRAMQHGRVIAAAFSTNAAAQLPSGRTRVATIHLQVTGSAEPQYELKLEAAADPDGKRILTQATCAERKQK